MNKVPRYMKEYKNSILKSAYEKLKTGFYNDELVETPQKAERIVKNYERGLITENESMRLLTELFY